MFSKGFCTILFISVLYFSGITHAAQSPIVDVVTSSTSQNISAQVINILPTGGINWQNFVIPEPHVALTALTQTQDNRFFLFTLGENLSHPVAIRNF